MKRMNRLTICAGIFWGVLAVLIQRAAAVEPQPPQEERVAKLVEQLSDPDPQVRATADDALYDLPPNAFPLLEAASRRELPPDASQSLKAAVDAQRPKQAARLRIWTQLQADYVINETSALEEYRTVGRLDSKWDSAAEDALAAAIAPETVQLHSSAMQKMERVLALGCDDPLVRYYYLRVLQGRNFPVTLEAMHHAVDQLEQSKYSAPRKLNAERALLTLASSTQHAKTDPTIEKAIETAVAELPSACSSPIALHSWIVDWASTLNSVMMEEGRSRKEAFDQIEPVIEKAIPLSSIPYVLKGEFYTNYAWDARGRGWAGSVTDNGWHQMQERLAIADEALSKAWTLDPTDSNAAKAMITVELGQGEGRLRMEKWFALAMAANPDNYDAYWAKMYYLEPKWYGSAEQVEAFAQDCIATKRWSSGIPLIATYVHRDILKGLSSADQKKAYAAQPQVWQDINEACTRELRQYPADIVTRNRYTMCACLCGRLDIAGEQLNILGDDVDAEEFGGTEKLQSLRQAIAESTPTTRQ